MRQYIWMACALGALSLQAFETKMHDVLKVNNETDQEVIVDYTYFDETGQATVPANTTETVLQKKAPMRAGPALTVETTRYLELTGEVTYAPGTDKEKTMEISGRLPYQVKNPMGKYDTLSIRVYLDEGGKLRANAKQERDSRLNGYESDRDNGDLPDGDELGLT